METSESKSAYRHVGSWVTALVVIIVGIFFLLNNFGVRFGFMEYQNWWALFILIGAAGPLSYAVHRYRKQGKMDGVILNSLVTVAAIITVALMFLLNLDWGMWWPLYIIYGGLYMLASSWKQHSGSTEP